MGTLREDILNHTSLSSSYDGKCVRKKGLQKIKTHILCSIPVFFSFSKIVPFMR